MRADSEYITQAPPQDYHRHYGLEHDPFAIESDTSLFVLSAGHEQALDKLYRGLLGRKSFVVITGAPGTGKTLLLQTLMDLARDHCEFLPIYPEDLQSGTASPQQLSGLVLAGATPRPALTDIKDTNALLRSYIAAARKEHRHPTIVIDEAQRLSDAALETLRCWSNMDSYKGRAVQFLLAGQQSLSEQLNKPELAHVKQRIATRCELTGLSLADTQRYLAHRCLLAGAARPLFDHRVLLRIFSLSNGYPRLINSIADALLLQAYLRGGRSVSLADVAQVSKDLDLNYAPIVPRPATAEHKKRAGGQVTQQILKT